MIHIRHLDRALVLNYDALMEFEWDDRKARRNVKKHGLSFQDAAMVFGDPLALTFHDPDHSDDEDRYLTYGCNRQGKYVVVSHTDRGNRIRILSARFMTRRERQFYEED